MYTKMNVQNFYYFFRLIYFLTNQGYDIHMLYVLMYNSMNKTPCNAVSIDWEEIEFKFQELLFTSAGN